MSVAAMEVAVEIAHEAGARLARAFVSGVAVEAKGRFDVVTSVDRDVEAGIVRALGKAFPGHAIVAEEGGMQAGATGWRWYVDPLDGTKNFARGNPAFAVSLALEREGELLIGVVLAPLTGELFAAEHGAGATRNDEAIRVSAAGQLEECLVATGFPSASRHRHLTLDPLAKVSLTTQGLRRSGSSALDLCHVGCGRVDAFWDIGLQPWDVAAGVAIVREAGGRCSHLDGGRFAVDGPDLLAAGVGIHGAFVRLFSTQPPAVGF
jgi:myo-inositol-1(or 4)-monophosphatase